MARAISSTGSVDPDYVQTLMKASLAKQAKHQPEEVKEIQTKTLIAQKESQEEEKKEKTINDLLDGFEKEMDIDDIDDKELINQANLAAELNLMKQTSSQLLEQDKKRQSMLKSNLSTDRHIDV